MTITRTPKILQWIARRAGIANQRAEELWYEAERRAALQTGSRGDAAYHRASLEQLYELVGREQRTNPRQPRSACRA